MKLMARSIQEMYDKFKYLLQNDAFFYSVLIILVAVASFGLGRWSMAPQATVSHVYGEKNVQGAAVASSLTEATTTLEKPSQMEEYAPKTASVKSEKGVPVAKDALQYVASKNGSKYYLLSCSGVKRIKEENKIYFPSPEEARKAGYAPALNCKGI